MNTLIDQFKVVRLIGFKSIILALLILTSQRIGLGNDQEIKEFVEVAKESYDEMRAYYDADKCNEETVYIWSVRLMEAESLAGRRIPALEAHLTRMQKLHASNEAGHGEPETGNAPLATTKFYMLQARIWLSSARRGK